MVTYLSSELSLGMMWNGHGSESGQGFRRRKTERQSVCVPKRSKNEGAKEWRAAALEVSVVSTSAEKSPLRSQKRDHSEDGAAVWE